MDFSKLIYFDDSYKELSKAAFIAYIEEVETYEGLMSVYNEKLSFPYFGFNWNALLDCLCTLDWIEQKEIVIIHKQLPLLSRKDFIIYLEILCDASITWENYSEEHRIKVYFQAKDKEYINELLKEVKLIPKENPSSNTENEKPDCYSTKGDGQLKEVQRSADNKCDLLSAIRRLFGGKGEA